MKVDQKKKGPRWASARYKTSARKSAQESRREPEFNHKAAHVLSEQGHSGAAIAAVLGISLRSVRYHLSTPCTALEEERAGAQMRVTWRHLQRTKRGRLPFCVEEWLVARGLVPEAEAHWLGSVEDWRALETRDKVEGYMLDGQSQATASRLLGISRQAVSKHVKSLRTEGLVRFEQMVQDSEYQKSIILS